MNKKNDIMHLIRKISFRMKNGMDASLKENDLTFTQMLVLRYISHADGEVSQKKIQEYLNVSHPTVVGLVKRLENHGFVECQTDEKDKRNKIVFLTQKARDFGKTMEENRKKAEKTAYGNFSREEVNELTRLLNKLYENINKEGKEDD